MSQENVEVAKRAIDAYNRRDVDDFAELTTPDFEFFPAMDRLVEGGSHRGRGASKRTSTTSATPGRSFACSPTSFVTSAPRFFCGLGESRGLEGAAACESMRR